MGHDLQQRPLSELPLDVREALDKILGKTPMSLSQEEKEFLFGRRQYLSAEQRKYFGADTQPERTEAEEETEEEEELEMTVEEIKEKLTSLNVRFAKNASEKKLRQLLEEALAEEESEEEEGEETEEEEEV